MGYTPVSKNEYAPSKSTPIIHIVLFGLTLLTTTVAGVQWQMKDPYELTNLQYGLTYAVLLLGFLTAHEFGHYFAARFHGIDVTLPYYIPMPPQLFLFGTMGALIRIRERIPSRKALFDIGVAGPLAGFFVCLLILIYGYTHLPPIEYLYEIHPEYRVSEVISKGGMYFGDSILFSYLGDLLVPEGSFLPPMNEIYHYPFLCVGWFGLFVTALNMLPFGQLDGGHVLYALTGRFQHKLATILWWLLIAIGALGIIEILSDLLKDQYANDVVVWLQDNLQPYLLYMRSEYAWLFSMGQGWLLWAILIRFLVRIKHPEISDFEPLDFNRRIIGALAFLILVVSFPPRTIYFADVESSVKGPAGSTVATSYNITPNKLSDF